MRPITLWLLWLVWTPLLFLPIAYAKPGQALRTCKPCGGTLIENAREQAEAIVLGTVSSSLELTEEPVKGGPGQGTLRLRVQRWLKKPTNLKKSKGLAELKITTRWDGACVPPPPSLQKGERWVAFLVRNGKDWESLPGHCASKFADPSEIQKPSP